MKKSVPKSMKNQATAPITPILSCRIISDDAAPCCTILENISDGVFTIDLEKRITFFSRSAESITGFNLQEAIGHHCFDVFRANICERKCLLDETIASGKPLINLPARIITKSGKEKPISISTAALKDSHGKIIGGVETFRDLSEVEELRKQFSRNFTHLDIVGRSPRMREILSFLPDIAESESPVIIEGPTGSGKELIARALHTLSPRKEGPFIAINCAALPDTLLESELFGYSKGAFTGAVRDKAGRFLLADKGTLFLDEINNTSLSFQTDLLRVLEEGEFTPLGATKTIHSDFRVVVASNQDLKKLVGMGSFREDLYYRLAVVKINLPPLTQRKEDIPLLIDHFIHKFNILKGKFIRGMTSEALAYLLDYPFPGNIRELENIIEYAFISCKDNAIGKEHLPKDIFDRLNNKSFITPYSQFTDPYHQEEAEKIRQLLHQHDGNRIQTARALGISRITLWRKLKKYNIERP
jgi:PAS domain S-box-containing protein